MKEFEFIKSIRPDNHRQPSVVTGIGDDGAVVKTDRNYEMVVASDTMVEGVHFSLSYMSLEDIGYRVLAANISDLAAMGSTPLYYLVNIVSPKGMTNQQLVEIYKGMDHLANQYHMDLIGGDTVTGSELVISITVIGQVLPNRKRLRSYAREGDVVFVTGNLGESAYGLYLLQMKNINERFFINRHIRPIPDISFVQATQSIERICLNDISDGIASELNEIAEASKVNLTIHWEQLPVHPKMKGLDLDLLRKFVLSSGEDFHLLGTCSIDEWEKIKLLCTEDNLELSRIGEVTEMNTNQPTVYIKHNQHVDVLKKQGYEHE